MIMQGFPTVVFEATAVDEMLTGHRSQTTLIEYESEV